jgi:type I restriction enzyme, S subunit
MNWPLQSLRDAGVEVFDGPHATPPKSDIGPIFLGISNLDNGRLNLAEVERIDGAHWAKWTRRVVPRAGDIVFSYETRLGQAAIIPNGLQCCLGRRLGLLRVNPERLNARYLLYAYLSPTFQAFLETRVLHGSTVDRLPIAEFPDFPVPIPPLPVQCGMAEALGALDDKIDANERVARSLEALCAALFRSWFVDFDPAQAKRDSKRLAGVPGDIQCLFPQNFQVSEIGPIPKGWEVVRLADCGTWVSGGTPSKQNPRYWNGDIPWISAKSLHTFFLEDSEDRITAEGAANGTRLVPEGSVLFLVRGMSLASEFRLGVAARELALNQDTKAIVPREDIDGLLIALLLRHETDTVLGLVDDATHGTKRLQTDLIESLKLALPPPKLRSALVSHLRILADRQLHNQRENRTLAALRDTLLPALLSGEISIKQAEKAVAKVA